MSSDKPDESLRGHEIRLVSIERDELNRSPHQLDALIEASLSGIVIKKALAPQRTAAALEQLRLLDPIWSSPNEGMEDEIKTL